MLTVGCGRPEPAPEAWPESGCGAAAPVAESVNQTHRHDHHLATADGLSLAVAARTPDGVDCAGVVVEAPPGFEPGLEDVDGEQAKALSRAGLIVVTFDPRGRGESEGDEDINGEIGQEDYAGLVRWAASLDGADADRVVIWSRSIGGALAAGALSRDDTLRPLSWVDFESPAWLEENLDHTTDHTHDKMWALADETDDPSAWMDERSPAAYVGDVTVPYHRLQGIPDHALDYMAAAVAMIDGATASPRVTLNGEEVSGELSDADVRERAIAGGIEPTGDYATEAVLEAFSD